MRTRDGVSGARPAATVLDTWPFPVLLVALVGIVLLTTFAPSVVVGDTWMMLMAGREIVDHGLPHTESITILGSGSTWTDQQWLAHVLFYGAHELGGMRAVVVLDVALVVLALAFAVGTARVLAASSRATFLIGLLAVVAGPWGWTVRAQATALPLYAATLWLLVDAYRNGLRRRTLLVLPLLAVWANLHGSVLLGSGLAVLLAALVLVRRRETERTLAVVLLVGAPLCVLATPYGWDVVAYYDLMLLDAPFADILREWQWSEPSGTTALFWTLAVVAVALLSLRRCRERLTLYELLVLVVTFAGAVQAVRGVIWFALACAAILPAALDGLLTKPDPDNRRLNRSISLASIAGLAAALVFALAQSSSWFTEEWSERQVDAVRAASRDPGTRVFATNATADWLLWRIPDLRGRVAYDARFEVFDRAAIETIKDVGLHRTGWERALDGYDVVLVRTGDAERTLRALGRAPGSRPLYEDSETAVLSRLAPP